MTPSQEQKFDKGTIPSVSIDGLRIRTLRETQKLTQLYIASVVGVTTDTISRWENNRYPTIKRDNAEKLADALEVPLDEILRAEVPYEEPPSPPETPPGTLSPQDRRRPAWLLPLVLILLLTGGGMAAFSLLQNPPPAATRLLPPNCAPGTVIPVQVKISRNESGNRGLIVKERLPAGWRLVRSSPPAASGTSGGDEVKWLIPAGEGQVTISYTVKSPDKAGQQARFSGDVGVHAGGITRTTSIGGAELLTINGCHWADVNCDGRIDDNEIMPAYYLTEEMKELGLEWKGIEAIWSARGYLWDGVKKEFTLVK
jgi:transcriptional regulator with XRE-family HTH domain